MDQARFAELASALINEQSQIRNIAAAPDFVVRAFYRWHVMTPLFQPVFSNVSNGERVLVSTMMFRNEPF